MTDNLHIELYSQITNQNQLIEELNQKLLYLEDINKRQHYYMSGFDSSSKNNLSIIHYLMKANARLTADLVSLQQYFFTHHGYYPPSINYEPDN